jgi:hypothetical protein
MTTFLTAEPQLFVQDIGVAAEFYTQKLGFAVAFSYGEPPFYGQVFRDGARLNLRRVANGSLTRSDATRSNCLPPPLRSMMRSHSFSSTSRQALNLFNRSGTSPGVRGLSSSVIQTVTSFYSQGTVSNSKRPASRRRANQRWQPTNP